MVETIRGTTIEHNGDVDNGLKWLRNHWDDAYVLDIFENAKNSRDNVGEFRIEDVKGTYLLRCIDKDSHNYSLSWRAF